MVLLVLVCNNYNLIPSMASRTYVARNITQFSSFGQSCPLAHVGCSEGISISRTHVQAAARYGQSWSVQPREWPPLGVLCQHLTPITPRPRWHFKVSTFSSIDDSWRISAKRWQTRGGGNII
ncbi:hypothetical protein PoB_001706400 [Plakobranchus ocellatus]|uniref:Uncharacterized protein n=1 Tax=Plakobranchus ocellatus TaxID=259542 RepID=A0AAV3Z838_9GAST|nr:hypothetical protein PoB_001706400 [Plakobranchus ocellatus]